MTEAHSLAIPEPASSLYFAIRKAPKSAQTPLRALYTLHKKWREAATYSDQHQAVTTLNWWHHELENSQTGEINHPALIALKPWLNQSDFFQSLQGLLHGHMHWHHLTRVDTLDQLNPTIDAIGGNFAQIWLSIVGQTNIDTTHIGRAIWWTDQIRHIGHNLNPTRMWLPMSWLKELNLPVALLLNKQQPASERARHSAALTERLIAQAKSEHTQCQNLNGTAKSLRLLLTLREQLLIDIEQHPEELWSGIITVSPRRKWWRALTLHN
ncbi:hypothetical protein GCM10009007_02850 [Formosimonas limnophila]|uniref:Phytoene synthase n=1 Tax=Formosimonas limnophila TaxID=1384487 RepID=A0A8J3CLJ2_9BURK|nr:squalene/phytoene synthase family protein [Formosimonas limnophila]GHA65647.1 hypothetical protein GCM10009007_02850 [Formosimonas limnophila]